MFFPMFRGTFPPKSHLQALELQLGRLKVAADAQCCAAVDSHSTSISSGWWLTQSWDVHLLIMVIIWLLYGYYMVNDD
jgi:hypothetical protein